MKGTKRLINTVWTLEYEIISEDEIEIIKYTRDDLQGYKDEYILPKIELIEDSERTVHTVMVDKKPYKVINQKYIFDYVSIF